MCNRFRDAEHFVSSGDRAGGGLKIYQDRGIVIVVVNREDLQPVVEGANFITFLREKYEIVRLDLRQALTV